MDVADVVDTRKIVAIVEDDPQMAEFLSDMLKYSGHWQCHYFADGQVAKEQLPDLGAHLILLDIGLPSLDGVSLYRMLRGYRSTRHIPIIVITGSHGWQLQRMGLRVGLFLHKPFKRQELLTMIRALLPDEANI